jgi:hypothetical protein
MEVTPSLPQIRPSAKLRPDRLIRERGGLERGGSTINIHQIYLLAINFFEYMWGAVKG